MQKESTVLEPSPMCFELIKKFEGLRLIAYKAVPSEPYFTIGYGHYSRDIKKSMHISQQKAEMMLKEDVKLYSQSVASINPKMTQNQFDAICSLTYNIGLYNLVHSMLGVRLADLGDKCNAIDVARQIVIWVRAGGKVLPGLQKRRVAEANYFLGYEAFVLEDGTIYEHSISD